MFSAAKCRRMPMQLPKTGTEDNQSREIRRRLVRFHSGGCLETKDLRKVSLCVSAVWTCLRSMHSKPVRVMASLRALRTSSGTRTSPRTDSHARTADAVSFHSGKQRSFRPLPWIRTPACGCSIISSIRSHQFRDPRSTREPKVKHRPVTDAVPDSWVRSIQDRFISWAVRCLTSRVSVFFAEMARIRRIWLQRRRQNPGHRTRKYIFSYCPPGLTLCSPSTY